MRTRISRYTYAVSAIGLVLSLAVYGTTALLRSVGNDAASTAVGDFGGAVVIGACAIVILHTAFKFQPGDAVRSQWGLIGLGTLVYALGEFSWSYVEVIQKSDAFPSFADAFYVLTYVLLGAGIMYAALGYRRLVDIRVPAAVSATVSALMLGGLYVLLLRSSIGATGETLLAKMLSVGYPIGDVVLEFGPALLIVLVAWKLGRGSFGWPWWPLALGVALIAISDSGFALLEAKNLYHAGNPIDAGWMVGNVLVATGALVARDVFGVTKVRLASAEKAA